MPRTFFDLCEQVVEDAGISGTFTSVVNQKGEFRRVVNWVKRAVTEVEGVWFDWDFLHVFHTFDTIAAVPDYPATPDHNLWDVATAKIPAQNQPIVYEMWTRRKLDPTPLELGDPHMFTVLPDKSIRFYDTPSTVQTVTIEYWRRPTELLVNTDEPSVPVQFRDILVAKALQFYANYESSDEVKQQALEIFSVKMRQLESHSAPSRQARDSINTGSQVQVVAESSQYEFF